MSSQPSQQTVGTRPARDRERLDFEAERDADTTSWERAQPDDALIERWGRYGYLVTLPGGEAHFCAIGQRPGGGEFIGWCRCKGFSYHDGPCAHLCTIRKADWHASNLGGTIEGVGGEPIEIAQAVEADDLLDAEQTGAQRDGEVFGGDADAEAGGRHTSRLEDMTPAEREIFLAVDVRGLTRAEAGRETGRDPSTARTLWRRAVGKLDHYDGPEGGA